MTGDGDGWVRAALWSAGTDEGDDDDDEDDDEGDCGGSCVVGKDDVETGDGQEGQNDEGWDWFWGCAVNTVS